MRDQTKEGKSIQSIRNYKNSAEKHNTQMRDLMNGNVYVIRMVVLATRKVIKATAMRNIGEKETWT